MLLNLGILTLSHRKEVHPSKAFYPIATVVSPETRDSAFKDVHPIKA
jgi:hypothetical protein